MQATLTSSRGNCRQARGMTHLVVVCQLLPELNVALSKDHDLLSRFHRDNTRDAVGLTSDEGKTLQQKANEHTDTKKQGYMVQTDLTRVVDEARSVAAERGVDYGTVVDAEHVAADVLESDIVLAASTLLL